MPDETIVVDLELRERVWRAMGARRTEYGAWFYAGYPFPVSESAGLPAVEHDITEIHHMLTWLIERKASVAMFLTPNGIEADAWTKGRRRPFVGGGADRLSALPRALSLAIASLGDPDAALPDPDAALPDPDAALPDPDAALPETEEESEIPKGAQSVPSLRSLRGAAPRLVDPDTGLAVSSEEFVRRQRGGRHG